MVHFNIGKKIEVNPFDNVKYVKISGSSIEILKSFLDKNSLSVETRKIGDKWYILYNVELLNFTTLLTWLAPYRGIFLFKGKSIHFLIENDIMACW